MNNSALVIGFFALLFFVSCAEPYMDTYRSTRTVSTHRTIAAKYDAPLIRVERPANVKKRYGNTETIIPSDSALFDFEDSLISALIWLGPEDVNFKITNKSEQTMKLIWDDAAFIESDNTATRVMHAGVKFSERNGSMPASIIPRRGKLDDMATPTNRISWREGYGSISGDWHNSGIFSPLVDVIEGDASGVPLAPIDAFYTEAKKHLGEKVGLIVPLEIEGVKNEYTFWFQVKKVDLDTSDAIRRD